MADVFNTSLFLRAISIASSREYVWLNPIVIDNRNKKQFRIVLFIHFPIMLDITDPNPERNNKPNIHKPVMTVNAVLVDL